MSWQPESAKMDHVNADDVDPPLAFSGQRLDWRDLPLHIRKRISVLAGAEVTAESSATSGFSPGFVAVLELADGRAVFVKAVSRAENPEAPDQARAEIRLAPFLPESIRTPRMLWWDDDEDWVIIGWQAVPGRTPLIPWNQRDLDLVLQEISRLSAVHPDPGHGLAPTYEVLGREFVGWQRISGAGPDTAERLAEKLGDHGRWAVQHLTELVGWEKSAPGVMAGNSLVHGDLHSDNVMLDEHRLVWFIDWPHTSVGAPWLDMAFMLASVAAEGGGDPALLFADQAIAADVKPDDLRSVLAGRAGYYAWGCLQPGQQGLPNLQAFHATQARAALGWIRGLV